MRPLPRRLSYGEEATLVEHLGELRNRVVVALLSNLSHAQGRPVPPTAQDAQTGRAAHLRRPTGSGAPGAALLAASGSR